LLCWKRFKELGVAASTAAASSRAEDDDAARPIGERQTGAEQHEPDRRRSERLAFAKMLPFRRPRQQAACHIGKEHNDHE
jgi:hypothetical protein